MLEKAFQGLKESSESLQKTLSEFEQFFVSLKDNDGTHFETGVVDPDAQVSFIDLVAGIRGLNTMTSGLAPQSSILLPKSAVDQLATKINDLKTQLDAYQEILKTFPAQHGGISKIEPGAVLIVAGDGNRLAQTKYFNRIAGALDAALVAYYQLRTAASAPSLKEFSDHLGRAAELTAKIQQFADGLSREQATIEKRQHEIGQLVADAEAERKEVNRLYSESQNDRKSLSEYAAEGTDKIASIRSVQNDASSLASEVAQYQTQFKRFDDQLAAREQRVAAELGQAYPEALQIAERFEHPAIRASILAYLSLDAQLCQHT